MPHPLPPGAPAWTAAYLGLPYVPGDGECCHRAAAIWRDRFGLEVEVAAAHGDMARAHRLIGEALARGDWWPTDDPGEGDAVLMRKGPLVCHVGIWIAPGMVIHCTRAEGTILTPTLDLPAKGFHVVGCFRRATGAAAEALPMAA